MITYLKKLDINAIRAFYMGRIYPIVVCGLVLFGSLTGLEMYFNFLVTALFVSSLFICTSTRPMIVSLCTYIFQLSTKNSPSLINNSDYLYTGWRIVALIVSILSIFAAAFYFFFKNKLYRKIDIKRDKIIIPIAALCLAFLVNGAFSDSWVPMSLLFAFLQTVVYGFIFLLFFYGLGDEDTTDALMPYLSYVSALMASVIIIQLAHLFATADNVFVDGSINKEAVVLGWGIWNLVGACLAMLIPVIFWGVMHSKYSWAYFTLATLTWLCAVLTMSRNALIFASLAYATCVIIACFRGNYRKPYRIICAIGVLGVIGLIVLLWSKIQSLLGDYFARGFDSNGRYELWAIALKNFADCPIFGRGFSGFESVHKLESGAFAHMGPMPTMAHNTLFELLSATGIVGTLAYGYYRAVSLIPVFKRPTLQKTMLALSLLVTLGGSLLDNFVFNLYPMYFAMVTLALIHRADPV